MINADSSVEVDVSRPRRRFSETCGEQASRGRFVRFKLLCVRIWGTTEGESALCLNWNVWMGPLRWLKASGIGLNGPKGLGKGNQPC
ncbi:MAG: hypothetical protein ACTS4U_00590 [Candidatus Hodgkinia cicadicola]